MVLNKIIVNMEQKNQQQPEDQLQKLKQKNWSHLRPELLTRILSQLPASSVSRVKCTCKSLYNLIAHPFFLKLHLERTIVDDHEIRLMIQTNWTKWFYSMGPHPSTYSSSIESLIRVKHRGCKLPINYALRTELLGSCHGLFLVSLSNGIRSLWLWNPFTGDVIKLKPAPITVSTPYTDAQYMYGMGCASSIDGDYKVVQIRYTSLPHRPASLISHLKIEVMIYLLREASWRVIQNNVDDDTLRPFLYCYKLDEDFSAPYYAKGCVHWLGHRITDDKRLTWRIMCFDFGIEEFKVISLPDAQALGADWASLGVLRGCLSMVYHYYYRGQPRSVRVEIFLMKEDGVWFKQHVIYYPLVSFLQYLQFLCYTKDGKLLMQAWRSRLYLFDPQTGTYQRLRMYYPSPGWLLDNEYNFFAVAYTPSLVPLTSS